MSGRSLLLLLPLRCQFKDSLLRAVVAGFARARKLRANHIEAALLRALAYGFFLRAAACDGETYARASLPILAQIFTNSDFTACPSGWTNVDSDSPLVADLSQVR